MFGSEFTPCKYIPTREQLKISEFTMFTLLYLLETMCIPPCLKLENLQFDICTFEFIDIIPEVWSVSFPTKSHPMKLNEVYGNVTTEVIFWFKRLGIPFKVRTHSLNIKPPEFRQNIQSISLEISNSARLLTHALFLY